MKYLNLGSGLDYRSGWINVDKYCSPSDMKFDLAVFPYPFKSNSIDVINAAHILEHLPDTVAALDEWWRICKPKAAIHIRVPHYSHPDAYSNPTHKRYFTSDSMNYFTLDQHPLFERYGKARFRIVVKKVFTEPSKTAPLLVKLHAHVVNVLLRIHPQMERFAVLFGGASEIMWILEVIK